MNLPDGFAVPGATAGRRFDMDLLNGLRESMPDMVLVASTGVKYVDDQTTFFRD